MVEQRSWRHQSEINSAETRLARACAVAAALALAAAPSASAAPDSALGEWLTEDGTARVALAPCLAAPERLCGAVTRLMDPSKPTRDMKNPDQRLRGRPLTGLMVVSGMRSVGDGRWAGGKVYDPESGRTYDGKLRALGREKLRVEGCVLMICDSETWTRVEPGG